MTEVETARLLLPRWQDDDLERLVVLLGDPRVSRFLSHHGRPWPRTRSVEVFDHFMRQWEVHGFGPWAAIDFEVVGLQRIISMTRADHAASRRVMEKCGLAFQEQVVHKGGLVVWYALDRADWRAGQAGASR